MRALNGATLWRVLLAGGMILGACPAAFAGDDDGGAKAFFTQGPGEMTGAPQAYDQGPSAGDFVALSRREHVTGRRAGLRRGAERYRATAGQAATGGYPEATRPAQDPWEYYHAMGTMSVP